jgi:hypothetical protein
MALVTAPGDRYAGKAVARAANGVGHIPVMLDPVLAVLAPRDGETHVDATFGGGGYARALLEAADCMVIGIDRDPDAIARGQDLARDHPGRLTLLEGPFSIMDDLVADQGVTGIWPAPLAAITASDLAGERQLDAVPVFRRPAKGLFLMALAGFRLPDLEERAAADKTRLLAQPGEVAQMVGDHHPALAVEGKQHGCAKYCTGNVLMLAGKGIGNTVGEVGKTVGRETVQRLNAADRPHRIDARRRLGAKTGAKGRRHRDPPLAIDLVDMRPHEYRHVAFPSPAMSRASGIGCTGQHHLPDGTRWDIMGLHGRQCHYQVNPWTDRALFCVRLP